MCRNLLLGIFLWASFSVQGQALSLYDAVKVVEAGKELAHPFAGGFNQPQFSTVDWNEDGRQDLFIFDRSGNHSLSFVAEVQNGTLQYRYEPQYQRQLPALQNWALMADWNCDGKADLFTSNQDDSGITVYKNVSQNGAISFQLEKEVLFTTDSLKAFVATSDIPALTDVDGDGDLDLLTFDPSGIFVRWYERAGNGNCENLNFLLSDPCWGNFMEAGLNNDIILNTTCKGGTGNSGGGKHAGSSVCAIDMNQDGTQELILGDLSHENLVLLSNGGTPSSANMTAADISFPSNDIPANIFIFPAAFAVDIDQDGREDIVAAPNASGTSSNYHNLWYFRDVGTGVNRVFELQSTQFLESETIECGESSSPVFFDENGDGKLDLLVGNYLYRDNPQSDKVGLTLYRNIGSPTLPRYELITRDYLNLSSLFNPPLFGAHPTFGDLDQDGDQDLILGDLNGKVHYFQNEGGVGQAANFSLIGPEYKGIDVGQQAAPQLVDVNRDGKLDLLIGEQSGNLNYYENIGTNTQADFGQGDKSFGGIDVQPACCTGFSVPFLYEAQPGKWTLLVGAESGEVFRYDSLENNLTGTFPLRERHFGAIQEGGRISISGADIDQDGQLEWVVGNRRGGVSLFDDLTATAIFPEKSANFSVQLFPNPGKRSQLQLEGIELPPQEIQLQIYTPTGQSVFSETVFLSQSQSKWPLPLLPTGLYLVRLVSEQSGTKSLKWQVP